MSYAEPLTTHLSTLLDTYISSFNARNFSAAALYYSSPAVSISASSSTILPSREDLAAFLSDIVTRLEKDGFDHSEWTAPKKVIVLDEGLVLVSTACKRVRGDGTSCEEFGVTYTLRREGERWLIVGILHGSIEGRLR
jgi:ketosteroid isomerase-like protein